MSKVCGIFFGAFFCLSSMSYGCSDERSHGHSERAKWLIEKAKATLVRPQFIEKKLPSTDYSGFITMSGDFNSRNWVSQPVMFDKAETTVFKGESFKLSIGGETVDEKIHSTGVSFSFSPKNTNVEIFVSKQDDKDGLNLMTTGVRYRVW